MDSIAPDHLYNTARVSVLCVLIGLRVRDENQNFAQKLTRVVDNLSP